MPVEIIDILKPKNNGDFPVADAEDVSYDSEKTIKEKIDEKQDKLVSGTNIKSVNGQSLLGAGNIEIESGSNFEIPEIALTPTSINPLTGTLTDEQIGIMAINPVIKFNILNGALIGTACQYEKSSDGYGYGYVFALSIGTYQLMVDKVEKTFEILTYEFPTGIKIVGDNLGLGNTSVNLQGDTISKTSLREFLGDKYTISVSDGVLTIKENF